MWKRADLLLAAALVLLSLAALLLSLIHILQQTRVEAVRSYYQRFLEAAPCIEALAALSDDALLKLWEGLGYYTRARNLKRAAQKIVGEYGGIFPTELEKIRALPGVGPYTAGAIASICFGQPTPAVDGNVLRVMARVLGDGRPVEKLKREVHLNLERVYPKGHCADFTPVSYTHLR